MLSVCSLKGGVGKTSVVLGLASSAQQAGISTLVVDLDPQGDAMTGLDVAGRVPATAADVIDTPRGKVLRSAVLPSGWTRHGDAALDVLVGGPELARHERPDLRPKQVHALARALPKLDGYGLVLVDCPPSLGGLTRMALAASARALIVTEPGVFAINAADRALQVVHDVRGGFQPSLQPLGILVNRVRPYLREHQFRTGELTAMFGPLVLRQQLPERSAVQRAQGAAEPIHRLGSPGARDVAEAFDQVLARAQRAQWYRRARS